MQTLSLRGTLRTIIAVTLICLLATLAARLFETHYRNIWKQEASRILDYDRSIHSLKSRVNNSWISLDDPDFKKVKTLHSFWSKRFTEIYRQTRTQDLPDQEARETLHGIEKDLATVMQQLMDEQKFTESILSLFYLYLLTLALGTGIYLTFRFQNRISHDLGELGLILEKVAEGDLSTPIEAMRNKEFIPLSEGVNAMRSSILQSQEALSRKQRLESLGTLAAGMAHELGNPLGRIQGFSELIAESGGDTTKKDIQKIQEAVTYCRKIVDDLQVYCRQEELGELETPAEQFVSDIKSIPLVNDAALKINIDENLRLKAPRLPLKQIFTNLIQNADLCGASSITLEAHQQNNRLHLLVSDDGPGLNDEDAAKIFDPFFTNRPTGEGTGLGLTISHYLAEQIGGDLKLKSNAKPTVFSLDLKA